MGKIYTRTGDDGTTGIHGGTRVAKDDPRIEANGALDELNCHLGIVRTRLSPDDPWQELLHRLQRELMVVMSLVATPSVQRDSNPNQFDESLTTDCEHWIDASAAECPDRNYFVLPGGTPAAAELQLARAVARRAERRLWTLHRIDPLPIELLRFINRLSDLLFVMARTEMQRQNLPEERWKSFGYKNRHRNE
ncbi:MAG: cob(I)yrinic acid a,c-diamide adenosyltransferase [Alistipes sp.]|nr:cob(I)yrinic acid a,c-diamide adenosyltransferase [Alistipes sp.]